VLKRLFSRARGKTAEVKETTATEQPASPDPAPPADVASSSEALPAAGGFGRFRFDVPPAAEAAAAGATLQSPAAAVAEPDVAEVVRRRVAPRRRPGSLVADRGVTPMVPPGLGERAVLYRVAAVQRARSAPDEALDLWRGYLELCPDDGEGWFIYATCLLDQGDADGAWEAFAEAREHAPWLPRAAGALGFLSMQRGAAPEAAAYFSQAVDLAPEDRSLLEALADAQEAAGMAAEARLSRARLASMQRGAADEH
jgi:tetratricopeptide (TPR) repeat protein